MALSIRSSSSHASTEFVAETKLRPVPVFHSYLFQGSRIPRPIKNPSLIHLLNQKQVQQLRESVRTLSFTEAVCFFIRCVRAPTSGRFISLILDQKIAFCVELASYGLDHNQPFFVQAAIHTGFKYPCSYRSFGFLLYAKGIVYLEKNELDLGVESLRHAYILLKEHAPEDFLLCKLCFAWGKALLIQNRREAAKNVLLYIKHCRLDLEDPDQLLIVTQLRYLMARCLDFDAQADKVFHLLTGGLKGTQLLSEKDQIDYFMFLGDASFVCKKNKEAIVSFQFAISVNQTYRKQKLQAEWKLGRAYLESKEYRLAIGVFREFVKGQPSEYLEALITMATELDLSENLYD